MSAVAAERELAMKRATRMHLSDAEHTSGWEITNCWCDIYIYTIEGTCVVAVIYASLDEVNKLNTARHFCMHVSLFVPTHTHTHRLYKRKRHTWDADGSTGVFTWETVVHISRNEDKKTHRETTPLSGKMCISRIDERQSYLGKVLAYTYSRPGGGGTHIRETPNT